MKMTFYDQFQKQNYNVRLSVGMHHSSLLSVVSTFNSGAGPNVVDQLFLQSILKKAYTTCHQANSRMGFKSADPY